MGKRRLALAAIVVGASVATSALSTSTEVDTSALLQRVADGANARTSNQSVPNVRSSARVEGLTLIFTMQALGPAPSDGPEAARRFFAGICPKADRLFSRDGRVRLRVEFKDQNGDNLQVDEVDRDACTRVLAGGAANRILSAQKSSPATLAAAQTVDAAKAPEPAGSAIPPVSVFGIALERPLTIPMCGLKHLGSYSGRNVYTNNAPSEGACWGHHYNSKIPVGQPMADGLVEILFAYGSNMSPMSSTKMDAEIVDGKLQYLRFTTWGLDTQEADAASFTAKFGQPTKLDTFGLQNGFGARFEAILAEWRVSPTLKATFRGWGEGAKRDEGVFTIGTPAGVNAYEAYLATLRGPPPVSL